MKFKIELHDEKVKIVANEHSFVFETTSDGVTVGPDFIESNRIVTLQFSPEERNRESGAITASTSQNQQTMERTNQSAIQPTGMTSYRRKHIC